jgi:hypothetical protein
MIDPDVTGLIDRSIADLEDLAVLFANEVERARHGNLGQAQRRQKEVLLTINILLPKLRTARGAEDDPASRDGRDNLPFGSDA